MSGSELPLIGEAFASNYIAPCGPMVDRFEREFAEAVGLPNACAVSSGTAAIDLLFHELNVAAGDTVFCSSLTFVASIAPAVHRGAVPVFIDCDAATWTMDPDLLEEALSDAANQGRLPKAVVAADLYGQCCAYERIEAACAKYEVPLIVDAAEALGARYCGRSSLVHYCDSSLVGEKRRVSSAGDDKISTNELMNSRTNELLAASRQAGDAGWAAVYSFNGNKIITTSGGGMVASRDGGVIARARKRAQQSREPVAWYEHEELGYNYRMSNIVAAIGVGQLACLERIVQKKRQIFEWYRERLSILGGVGFMPEAAYGQCTRWLTVIEIGGDGGRETGGGGGSSLVHYCDSSSVGAKEDPIGHRQPATGNGAKAEFNTNELMSSRTNEQYQPSARVERVRLALEAEEIESRPVWKPMHLQPVFRGARVYGGGVSARLFANGLCLPSGAGLAEAEVGRVCALVTRALA